MYLLLVRLLTTHFMRIKKKKELIIINPQTAIKDFTCLPAYKLINRINIEKKREREKKTHTAHFFLSIFIEPLS